MTSAEWINLVGQVAWPLVALAALIYIWRSDALAQLIQISKSVDELRGKLDEVVQTEQQLRKTTQEFSSIRDTIKNLSKDLADAKTGIEILQDKGDPPTGTAQAVKRVRPPQNDDPQQLLGEIEKSWRQLVNILHKQFGDFDERSFAFTMRIFAEANTNGPKLSNEQADEIARLHSTIKSYRRRQKSVHDWIDGTIRNHFVDSCDRLSKEVNEL